MRNLGTMLAAAALALAPAPALAQLTVKRGESLTVKLDEARNDGSAEVVRREPATPTAFEKRAGGEFARGEHPEAIGSGYRLVGKDARYPEPGPVAPGELRIRFTEVEGYGHALLVIENGYDRALAYRATIRYRDQAGTTDVCEVVPGRRGLEHWPFAIDAIELSDLKLIAWKPEDGIRCE